MCYSAQIEADYRKYLRLTGGGISLHDFYELFWRRQSDPGLKIPKAVEAWFAQPKNERERPIKARIDEFNEAQAGTLEQEMFKQRRRLADAERALQTRSTKKDAESLRIATAKIEWAKGKLADLRRSEPEDRDARIFPGHYAPVLVMEGGRRVVKPMRYQCRPAGKPAFYDTRFPGTSNARRDSLGGFWKGQKGEHCAPGRSRRTWCSSSGRGRRGTCWWPACGRAGRRRASRIFCRSPRSPMSRQRKWPPPDTTAASFRSDPRTWMRG